jgi:phosphotransferase system  glucose/maltose/N-acetylglucosamine-specific IIC component
VELFIVVVWLGLAIAIGAIAGNKGRSGFGWFLFALLLSPLIAGFFLLLTGEGKANKRKCTMCAEDVRVEAIKCKHCGADLPPVATKSPSTPPSGSPTVSQELTKEEKQAQSRFIVRFVAVMIGLFILGLLAIAFNRSGV